MARHRSSKEKVELSKEELSKEIYKPQISEDRSIRTTQYPCGSSTTTDLTTGRTFVTLPDGDMVSN